MDNPRELPVKREPMMAPYMLPPSAPEGDGDIKAIMSYFQIFWKRKWIIMLGAILGAVAGAAITFRTTPMYRTTMSLEIQSAQEPFQTSSGPDDLQTHALLLQNMQVRSGAAAKVNAQTIPPLPQVTTPLSTVREWLGMPDPIQSIPWSQAVAIASGSVTVAVPKDTRVLTLQTVSPNPQAAADFLTALAEEYIMQLNEQRWQDYQRMNAMLDRAQGELKEKLENSEEDVANLAKSAGLIVMASETQSLSEEEFRQVQQDLASARSDRKAIEARYRASMSTVPGESLPAVLDSGPMASYQAQITNLRQQIAQLSTTFTPEHYRVKEVQRQVEELQVAMEKERRNVVSRLEIDFQAARDREDGLQNELEKQARVLADQGQMLSQYSTLKREQEINKKLYEATLQQGKEATVSSAIGANNARIAEPARVPTTPFQPNLLFNVPLGLLGGLFVGLFGAVLLSFMDASIKNPGVFEGHFNVRDLGAIPSAKTDPGLTILSRRTPGAIGGAVARISAGLGGALLKPEEGLTPRDCLELVTWSRQRSIHADAFRAAMTSILFASETETGHARVLLVTSPATQEGKSTVISNLGIAFAEIGQRVLIIDGDMRLPRIHTIFGLPNTFGLSGVLNERTPVSDYDLDTVMFQTFIPGLQVMPAGQMGTSLSRLLHSGRMKYLIERLRGEFDTILIDSAPVLTVPDARVMARAADGVILVIRAYKTSQESAIAVAKCLEEDQTPLLGTILNDWRPKDSGYGYGRNYGSYSQYHSSGGE